MMNTLITSHVLGRTLILAVSVLRGSHSSTFCFSGGS